MEYPYFGTGPTCRSFLDIVWFANQKLSRELFSEFYFVPKEIIL
jgi:hypothetical protein